MSIASFIRAHLGTILDEWEQFARTIAAVPQRTRASLRDHAEGILLTIAGDLEQAQSAAQQEQKGKGNAPVLPGTSQARRHGSDRVLEGYTVNDAMSEYRALRASVVRLWSEQQDVASMAPCVELIRFNEAIDQALTESLAGYSEDKERSTRLYHTLLSASPDLSFIVDTDARLVYGNAALAAEFGEPLSRLKGKRFGDPDCVVQEGFEEHVRLAAHSKTTTLGEMSRQRRGASVTYEYLLVPVLDEQGQVEAVAGIARDVTKRKASEERHRRSAHYDDLTGLPNRQLFRDRLAHEIKRADRIGLPLALMFLDLDGFKEVNDLLGHAAGDELLRQGAARIGACVRDSDTVARLGGDEFTVILTEIRNMPHVDVLARHLLEELARPFVLDGQTVAISASIGIALYPHDANDAAQLLRHADQAMYAVKHGGRNRFCYFTDDMREASWQHLKRIDELRLALAGNQFVVRYQPVVALAGGAIVGAEAQLRWLHPVHGELPAADFIGLAEEAGLAGQIDEWVLEDALERAGAWEALRGAPLFVSINKSSLGLTGQAAEVHWKAIIERVNLARPPVALEIAETMLLSQARAVRNTVQDLARSGVKVCLDGFGSGPSSIASLTKLPLAGLKIAAALVHALREPAPLALAKGIIASGHALGIPVTAEGVETHEQKMQLAELGCDYAQGYLFFEAMAPEALSALLAAQSDPAPTR
jgi:diguanylate cyclase (GGDEF)-like protein/PAS domain S-box-containing protein